MISLLAGLLQEVAPIPEVVEHTDVCKQFCQEAGSLRGVCGDLGCFRGGGTQLESLREMTSQDITQVQDFCLGTEGGVPYPYVCCCKD